MKRKYLKSYLAVISVTAASFFGISSSCDAAMAYIGNLETGNLTQFKTTELPKSDSGTVVSSPRREGSKALKILLRRGDSDRPRAEVMPKAWSAYPSFVNNYQIGQEYWYSFSVYLPSDWVIDNDKEILFQFHSSPDRDLGEEFCRNPPLALYVDNDKWGLRNRADGRRYLSCDVSKQFEKYWMLGTIKRGGWTDWVFRIKWSYGADGIMQVWKDGQLVMSRTGMNTYNDAIGPYLKLGLYKFTWGNRATLTNRRELYFDGVKIEKGPSSLLAMSPPGTAEPLISDGATSGGTIEGTTGGDTTVGDTGNSPTDGTTGDGTTGTNTDTGPTAVADVGGTTNGDTGSGSTEVTAGSSTAEENTDTIPTAVAGGGGGGGAEAPFYLSLLAMLALARSGIIRREKA